MLSIEEQNPSQKLLSRIVLNDERFLNSLIDLVSLRRCDYRRGQFVRVGIQPVGSLRSWILFEHLLDELDAFLSYRHDLTRLELIRRSVDSTTVDGEVTVGDQLSGLQSGRYETCLVDDVVDTAFAKLQNLQTGRDLLLSAGYFVVGGELLFEKVVVLSDLLFLAELQGVLGVFLPSLSVLTRTIATALDGALSCVATRAFQKELYSFMTA